MVEAGDTENLIFLFSILLCWHIEFIGFLNVGILSLIFGNSMYFMYYTYNSY